MSEKTTSREGMSTHDIVQEVVDGSRLMRIGKQTRDPETTAAGWKRVRKVKGGTFTKKIFDSLPGPEKG